MPRFRPVDPRLAGVPFTLEGVRRLAAEAMAPRHFFVAPDLDLDWVHVPREEISWEVFRGRLLDPAHTRERAVFEAWSVYEKTPAGRSGEPVLSLKLDEARGMLYVVRGLECYVWEGYDSGGGVILSREVRKWVRELVATIRFEQFADLDELHDEIICGLYHAVVGTSRLPLTSVEAPLPAFSFGRLFYSFRDEAPEGAGPLRTWRELLGDLLQAELAPTNQPDLLERYRRFYMTKHERAHLLETVLHAVPFAEMRPAADEFRIVWRSVTLARDKHWLFTHLFDGVSLSPWTDLTDKLLAFVREVYSAELMSEYDVVRSLGYILRQIGRHLTAYDLVTFHHRGANYPDALLLDAVLKEYLGWAERFPHCFLDAKGDHAFEADEKRLLRRALRQAYIIRRHYEGHPVPDMPTSPGENNRVLPPSHPRIPEEQILQSSRRPRKLYEDDPLPNCLGPRALEALRKSVDDLTHPSELQELSVGIFLDRPLSANKAPSEPDVSPLFAAVAFSRSIAVKRIQALAREEIFLESRPLLDRCLRSLLESPPRGLPLDRVGGASRPGSVRLTDARLASPDFEFLWTTRSSLETFKSLFNIYQFGDNPANVEYRLIVRNPAGAGLQCFDSEQRLRMEIEVDGSAGHVCRAGVEYPAAGLLVTRLWGEAEDGSLREHDLRAAPIRVPPI
jgi:hypothetical protein